MKAAKKKKPMIKLEACLKQSTPSAKPIKFGPDGEADIIFETDGSQMTEVVKLLAFLGTTFTLTITARED